MSELGVMGKTHHQMVESNMLSLLCEEKLSPGELEAKILEKLPNPVRIQSSWVDSYNNSYDFPF